METNHRVVATGAGPVPVPWPTPLVGDFMSELQWDVFYALLDGILPGFISHTRSSSLDSAGQQYIVLPDEEFEGLLDEAVQALPKPPPQQGASADGGTVGGFATSREELTEFFEYRPAADPLVRQDCLAVLVRSGQREKLARVLQLLTTRLGSLLFTGYWTPITAQPTHIRHAILRSWSTSAFGTLRLLAMTVASLAHKSTAVASSIFHRTVGYANFPRDWKRAMSYDFRFIQVPPPGADTDDVYTIDTDVVVVGSGCGGAVAASNIAKAGHRVLVVDKAYHFAAEHFPMPQVPALGNLFDNGGVFLTETGAGVLAASAWGGGGTVNWSVSLRPQKFVREEWAAAGLEFFDTPAFDECLDRVWDTAGASVEGLRHNHGNRVLLEGSRRLGFAAQEAAQNTGGQAHYCGRCHLGCGSAVKRGPAVSWLPEAAENGAEFMEGFTVERVIFDDGGRTAVGVEGLWASNPAREAEGEKEDRDVVRRRVRIRAKRVIISAGTIRSPLILMESGIDNGHLGKNLHIHPCNLVTATFAEDTEPWEGGIITCYNSEFDNQDGKGHGVKLEPTCMVPYASLSTFPWSDGLRSRMHLLKFRRSNAYIAITRDRDTGQVTRDPRTGGPQVRYATSDFDREHTLEGVQALAKICYVSGATEIQPHVPGLEPFMRSPSSSSPSPSSSPEDKVEDPEFADAAFGTWLGKVRQVGNKPPMAAWTSAHQMGTCRMGRSEEDGVVDSKGKVWGREGLYVADASVFPSASGVNPMVTAMAIADWISRGVNEGLASSGRLN